MEASPRGTEPFRGLSMPINEVREGAILQGGFLHIYRWGPLATSRDDDPAGRDAGGVTRALSGMVSGAARPH
jgi:hypothetical protein